MERAAALVILTLAAPAVVTGQEPKTGFLERRIRIGDVSHGYKVYVLPGFDPSRSWPIILFLHGAGERGIDGVQQTEVGLGRVLRTNPERFPAVVVFPQAPPGQVWLGDLARVATTALEQAIAEFRGDPDRISLVGLSMGAYASWVLAFENPERYAAIVSVAGGIVPPAGRRARLARVPPTLSADDPYAATAARVKSIPAWLFHGADDPTVPVTESRQIVAALEQGGRPHATPNTRAWPTTRGTARSRSPSCPSGSWRSAATAAAPSRRRDQEEQRRGGGSWRCWSPRRRHPRMRRPRRPALRRPRTTRWR